MEILSPDLRQFDCLLFILTTFLGMSLTVWLVIAIVLLGVSSIVLLRRKDLVYQTSVKQLNKSLNVLRSSLDSQKDVSIFFIDRQYGYVDFNNTFKLATEQAYHTHVKPGMSMLDSITNEEDRKKAKQNCDRALAGESHTTIEAYGESQTFYFKTRYNPVIINNEIIGISVIAADITEGHRAQEQVTSLNKELEAFSYSIAHDLRTPLRAIHAYTQVMMEDYHQTFDEECRRMMEAISRNAFTMGQMVDDLLNFSKLGRLPVHKVIIPASGLIKSILEEQLNSQQRAIIDVQLVNIENIQGDRTLIHHVLTNLISNAIKYSKKKERPVIRIDSYKSDHEVIYSIQDNGVGFDMKYEDKLFGVFHRLHKNAEFEGTGVGLAIVQRIILKHGGRVWAHAEVDKGATFYFSLPE